MRSTAIFFIIALAAIGGSVWIASRMGMVSAVPASSIPASAEIRDISPAVAWPRLQADKKIVLLDVRTPDEYAERHILGSTLLPVGPLASFGPEVEKLIPDKQTTVYVYCRSGRRSVDAAKIMASLGYRNVYNLGGINDWPYATE